MRKIILYCSAFVLISLSACQSGGKEGDLSTDLISNPASGNAEKVNLEDLPKFEFEKDTHDFGSITEGEKVAYSFKFKNTGKSDLLISSASGSCGCTVPNYPKTPIKPGESALIDVTFDSSGKQGKQTKTVTLIANTQPNTNILTIKGEVKPKQ